MLTTRAKTMIGVAAPTAILASTLWSRNRVSAALTPTREIGLVLAISGLLGFAAARFQLDRSFSIRAKATELVTGGIYSKIRNPVYVFGTIFTTGLILWAGRPIWLLALFVLVPMQVMRARNEAQLLEEKFGDAYRAYRTKTWF